MTKSVIAGAILALAPFAAFAQVTLQDVGFVAQVAHVDVTSIRQGQTAVTTAANPAVREFAQEMVRWHTDDGPTLASLLPPVPNTATPCMTWQSVLVQRISAPDFDPAYLQATIYNHTRLLTTLQGEIQTGANPGLKDYAQKVTPIIQAHLAQAQALLGGAPRALPAPLTVRPRFASGEWSLTPADQQTLNDFASRLTGMEQVVVTATGHTDNVPIGPELKRAGVPTNQVLSEKRAGSVKAYLVSKGVRADEIETVGKGETEPAASNATAAGRAQNRRVVLEVKNAMAPAARAMSAVTGIPACNE